MRKFLQRLLSNWIIRMSAKYGSNPDEGRIYDSLDKLYKKINDKPGDRGLIFDVSNGDKFVILSDQHKGARDYADDFAFAEENYLAALTYYNEQQFTYINLGDSEELWENLLEPVIKHNHENFELEKIFLDRGAFVKIFGNHDLYWDNDPLAGFNLKRIYGQSVSIYEGAILRFTFENEKLDIFLTHGHQGDLQSDGNWFSKWFVSNVWAPLQSYLRINPNTPAYDDQLKTKHNQMMYNWASTKKNLALITGHTHQPVFASLTHLEQLYVQLQFAKETHEFKQMETLTKSIEKRVGKGDKAPVFGKFKPSYFNSGCCCFSDGDITGIEVELGLIRLVKWSRKQTEIPTRFVLDEMEISHLLDAYII
ncbi:putative phosphodiesterase [Pedobacter sp. UYP30]|uniref:metallophosphoesterase n=1 Tax=Pedobacter sp. UYP30 TaxID=1756400 RepID=UPI003393C389